MTLLLHWYHLTYNNLFKIGDDDLASHMSLEVNTTGTGSQRGANDDFDDVDEQGGGDDVDEQGGGWGE